MNQEIAARASCPTHPGAADGTCARCGLFVCSGCLGRVGLCVPCAARQSPSKLAVASAILGALGFCAVFPGLIAIVLATVELSRIQRGLSPEQGADWARAGRTLGAVSLVLGALVGLIVWG